MGILKVLLVVGVAVAAYFVAVKLNEVPELPQLDPYPWWGTGEPRDLDTSVRPFPIKISKKDVDDLLSRLSQPPRVTESMPGTNFTYGVNSATVSAIVKHWREKYDWRQREKRINSVQHYKTSIAGLDIHFMRSTPTKPGTKKVVPLLMVHGWPGSVLEFYRILPLLTTPRPDSEIVFDVICPSIPGYGFSEAPSKPGLGGLAVAQLFVSLMDRLGHKKFYAQGGDWGSLITSDIATAFPDRLLGLHVNMAAIHNPLVTLSELIGAYLPSGVIMEPLLERYWYPLKTFYGRIIRETGYMHLQATKPDTVGVALNSSPQGLAAYILEKFSSWTDMNNTYKLDGGLLDASFPIPLDDMLDNVCWYWFSNSITTSMRFYAENFGPDASALVTGLIPTDVPTGLAMFLNDLAVCPKNFAAYKYTNIVTYSNPAGGHFAAMEVPQTLAEDLHNFVNIVESQMKNGANKR